MENFNRKTANRDTGGDPEKAHPSTPLRLSETKEGKYHFAVGLSGKFQFISSQIVSAC